MTSYLLTFAVYTSAMIGVIFLALFAYKKFSPSASRVSQSQFLEVEDCVSLGARKQLYVVRAGDEKFLIASDAERTTFLSKLDVKGVVNVEPKKYSQIDFHSEATEFRLRKRQYRPFFRVILQTRAQARCRVRIHTYPSPPPSACRRSRNRNNYTF